MVNFALSMWDLVPSGTRRWGPVRDKEEQK